MLLLAKLALATEYKIVQIRLRSSKQERFKESEHDTAHYEISKIIIINTYLEPVTPFALFKENHK